MVDGIKRIRLPRLINLDELFVDSTNAVVLNKDNFVGNKLTQEFISNICRNTDGELGFVPTCKCGHIRGAGKEGQYCSLCDSVCSTQFVNSLEHLAWIDIPEPLPPVLHPIWYKVLHTWTVRKSSGSILDIILNPEINDIPSEVAHIITGRGFGWLYKNADAVLDALVDVYSSKKKPKAKRQETEIVRNFIAMYRADMFTRKLPVIHNSLHPIKTGGDNLYYADEDAGRILEVAQEMTQLVFRMHNSVTPTLRTEASLYHLYQKCVEYYMASIHTKVGIKQGIARKQCLGSRLHHTLRTVVVAQDRAMPFDEIVPPWGMMVVMLKLVILNYLMHRFNKPMHEALELHRHALNNYVPIVDQCMRMFIEEHAPTVNKVGTRHGKRLPVLIGRNPTLKLGSQILLYISSYKTDPADESMSINAAVIRSMNADFDGDELYGAIIYEGALEEKLTKVHPSKLMLSLQKPGLGTAISPLSQNFVCLENWLREDADSDLYEEID